MTPLSRRAFLGALSGVSFAAEPFAQIAITLDLEMSMHYPTWGQPTRRRGDLAEGALLAGSGLPVTLVKAAVKD